MEEYSNSIPAYDHDKIINFVKSVKYAKCDFTYIE